MSDTPYDHVPHPWIEGRKAKAEQVRSFNDRVASLVTRAVGSMWCAYAFCLLALIGLPSALTSGPLAIVQWISQTFLQLVLLSIILVGQRVLSAAGEDRAECTYKDAESILAECLELQKHLAAQDRQMGALLAQAALVLGQRGQAAPAET